VPASCRPKKGASRVLPSMSTAIIVT
jgi:hypothetical protein